MSCYGFVYDKLTDFRSLTNEAMVIWSNGKIAVWRGTDVILFYIFSFVIFYDTWSLKFKLKGLVLWWFECDKVCLLLKLYANCDQNSWEGNLGDINSSEMKRCADPFYGVWISSLSKLKRRPSLTLVTLLLILFRSPLHDFAYDWFHS